MNENRTDLEALNDAQLLDLRERLDTMIAARGVGTGRNRRQTSQACRFFTINEDVRRMDTADLDELTASFRQWVDEARDARTLRSRERVLIVFLVLRYTGARLGEVLALDEARDIDFENCLVRIRQSDASGGREPLREVPLPQEVVESIRSWCLRNANGAGFENSPEGLFKLDQGFLRRKFYEQEERSGLPRELLNPRSLRNSRAVELLKGGMPMRAVQAMLGYSKSDPLSAQVMLADKDLKCIVRQYCQKEFGMETSARNTFDGHVVSIESNPVLCEVVLRTDSGYEIAAVITNQSREQLGLEQGSPATALVKATWVALEKGGAPTGTSARNAFPGIITSVVGDDVVADVKGKLDDGTPVCALVTATSLERLGIGEGDPFVFMFKAMSVIIS